MAAPWGMVCGCQRLQRHEDTGAKVPPGPTEQNDYNAKLSWCPQLAGSPFLRSSFFHLQDQSQGGPSRVVSVVAEMRGLEGPLIQVHSCLVHQRGLEIEGLQGGET